MTVTIPSAAPPASPPPPSAPSPLRPRLAGLVGLALWIGLSGGLLELGTLGVLKFHAGRPLWLGIHVLWMTPLAAAVICLVVTLPVLLVAQRGSPRHAVGLTAATAVASAGWGVLILLPGLHEKALLVVALGLGVQTFRMASRHRLRMAAGTRKSGPWLVLLIMLISGGALGWARWTEHRAGRLLPAAPAGAPNVLLLVLDTQRASSMSVYGHSRATSPTMERVAREGTVFDFAVSVSSWTLTGHAAMFTGHYPHQMSANWGTPLGVEHGTLAEALRANGYATAGFVSNTLYCQSEFGLNRGFDHYEDYVPSLMELLISSSLGRRIGNSRLIRRMVDYHDILARRSAADINGQFLAWLDTRPDRPFFAFLNYFDVHAGYLPPAPFDDLFGTKHDRQLWRATHRLRFFDLPNTVLRRLPPEARRAEQDAYDGATTYLDDQIGRLLDALEERGLRDNTLIVVTSDHGEQFGEHGLYLHGNSLYLPAIHVPLVFRLPGVVPAGLRLAEAVTLRDLPATVMSLIGLAGPPPFPGAPLDRLWAQEGRNGSGSHVLSSVTVGGKPVHSLILDGHHYIRWSDGRESLFALESDPSEQIDLATEPPGRSLLPALRATLDSILADSLVR